MEYSADYNSSSNSEGRKHPSLRSSSGSLGMDQRYPFPQSKSCPSLAGAIPNASSNPDASSIEIGGYSNSPTILEGSDSNICFEPEAMDSYNTAPPAADFNTWLPDWTSLSGSPHTTSSALDTYNTNFEQWQSLVVPWPGG